MAILTPYPIAAHDAAAGRGFLALRIGGENQMGPAAWGIRLRQRLRRLLGGRALAEAQAEARVAQHRLREALDVLPEGIVFLDAERRYILWNKSYAEIYHRSADLFAPGRKLEDTLKVGVARGDYPDAVGREDAWLAERISKLEHPTGERLEQRLADGRWLMIEERATADGGLIGLRVDITQMKQQAEALAHALARAEAASKAKNEFLADMSHELRTPLNGVMGLTEALARTELDHHQATLVHDILAASGSLSRIVSGLLDYGDAELTPAEGAPAHLAPAADPAQALRVLLADDNPTNRKVIELMLGAADASVTSVENGALAVEAWRGGGFDLVLMDLRMPVMGGIAAIEAIRAAEAQGGGHTPIVVLSANTSPDDRQASAQAGADGHIAKPIRAQELFGAIEAVLEG